MRFLFLIFGFLLIGVANSQPAMAWSCTPHTGNYYNLYVSNDWIFIADYKKEDGLYLIIENFKGPMKTGDKVSLECRGPWGCDNNYNLVFAKKDQDGKMVKTFLCGGERYLIGSPTFIPYARNIKFAEMTGIPFITLWVLDKRNIYLVLGIIFGVIPLMVLIFYAVSKIRRKKPKAAP